MAKQQVQQNANQESWGRFNFLGVAKYITVATIIATILAFVIIGVRGFNYGVDFAGGIEAQVRFEKEMDAGEIRKFMSDAGYPHANVQAIGDNKEYLLRVEMPKGANDAELNKYVSETVEKIKAGLNSQFAGDGS